MTPTLRTIAPGLLTTVQDFGRPGLQHLGIAPGGALDPVGLAAANALAGNPPNTAAFEIAYVGPAFAVEADSVRIALCGAAAEIIVLTDPDAPEGRRIPSNRSAVLHCGEVIRIGSLSGGALLYLAVEGGLAITPILGSAATYLRGGFGGWHGRAVATGDAIPLRLGRASTRPEYQLDGLSLDKPDRIRVIPGPQADYFSAAETAAFFAADYTIGHGDRMGIRLCGRRIEHARGFNIVSDAIPGGAIQIPGDGQPIVLLADRQTTGGYPKIATVISADLPALARLATGERVRFEPVTLEQAVSARRDHVALIDGIEDRVRPLALSADDLALRLNDNNLIDGVVRAVA